MENLLGSIEKLFLGSKNFQRYLLRKSKKCQREKFKQKSVEKQKEILHWVVGCRKEELNYQNVMSWLEALRGKRRN